MSVCVYILYVFLNIHFTVTNFDELLLTHSGVFLKGVEVDGGWGGEMLCLTHFKTILCLPQMEIRGKW